MGQLLLASLSSCLATSSNTRERGSHAEGARAIEDRGAAELDADDAEGVAEEEIVAFIIARRRVWSRSDS
jgi:hypothetical protein